jgi:hypothetical protein
MITLDPNTILLKEWSNKTVTGFKFLFKKSKKLYGDRLYHHIVNKNNFKILTEVREKNNKDYNNNKLTTSNSNTNVYRNNNNKVCVNKLNDKLYVTKKEPPNACDFEFKERREK